MKRNHIGTNIIGLEEVSSTNEYLLKLLEDPSPPRDGTVVWAKYQSKGKGQGKNQWYSDPGSNLLFSIVVFPRFLKAERQFLLNQCISLGILDYVRSEIKGKAVTVKWPNDIYIGNLKAGGILIQNSISGDYIQNSVIGIGININQDYFPPEIPNPTSFYSETGKKFNIEECLNRILDKLDTRYNQFISAAEENIHRDYLHSLFRYNEFHNYRTDDMVFRARIIGVNKHGKLILEEDTGKSRAFDFQELIFLDD